MDEKSKKFRDDMKYIPEEGDSISDSDRTKEMVTRILNGEITVKEAEKEYHFYRETIRRKIVQVVNEDDSLWEAYMRYQSRIGIDYGSFNFKGLIVYMIKNNLSQSELAERYGISSRTISREVEKLGQSKDPKDIRLYNIAKICADRKMKRKELSEHEKSLFSGIMDDMFAGIPIIDENTKSKTDTEIERLEEFMEQVQLKRETGMTIKQVAEDMGIGVSTIRRNKLKLEELKMKKKRSLNDGNEGKGEK